MSVVAIELDSESNRRIREKLQREFGFLSQFLEADDVIEVVLNPDGRVWVERLGQDFVEVGTMTAGQAESLMMTVAAYYRTTITRENPILECELPFDGSRFEGVIPPVVVGPTFAIRRRASRVFTLAEYVASGVMTAVQANIIRAAVDRHANILIVGGTGSGKTTLANAVIDYIAAAYPTERIVLLEDTVELQCSSHNAVALRATEGASMARLLRATLRLRPDRILVGEVRGPEAHSLLKAWNTGHPGGLATIHADDELAGLQRMEELVAEAGVLPQPQAIARAIGLVIHIARTPEGRRVQAIASVTGHDGSTYITARED